MAKLAYIGLGSNLGDRAANLRRAREALAAHPDVEAKAASALYETDPQIVTDQPDFLNAVLIIRTGLPPRALLAVLKEIEARLGRKETIRYGPRAVDLDILMYEDTRLEEEGLSVPHPRLEERAFVLVPLAELDPGLVLPSGATAEERAARASESQKVSRYADF
ncbi:MAG: 2-amino-4-hydroxy-6-hydroxymethyldihydropteridine diphosphokinase [Armatimonadetes bacterium]|nr:2-amino-4-hydroxy-6-hydroxymethyldihydropteridine diphosphokinase [Armatimonadota bacterium]